MLAMDEKNLTLAEQWFQKAVHVSSVFKTVYVN